MLSQKKGRRYGEGHQKAPQISVCPLPLAGIHTLEEAIGLPGLRSNPSAMFGIFWGVPVLPRGWESAPLAYDSGARRHMMVFRGMKQL
jgi:hypothetical protein